MKKYSKYVVWVVIAVVAFVGGMYYGKSTVAPAGTNGAGSFAAAGGRTFAGRAGGAGSGGGAAGGFVTGQVSSKDAQSITLQLPNGNSEVVFYSTSTAIIKPSPASANDLAPGTQVMVGGSQNSDGSFTAQSIQIRQAGTSGVGATGR